MNTVSSRQWVLPEQGSREFRELGRAFGLPSVVAQILYSRGVRSTAEAEIFLNPLDQPLTEPACLTDMDRAVERIERARQNNESVRVFGDYDVDGVAGTALLTRALRRYGIQNVTYDLPDRIADGYGLNPAAVRRARDENVDLIVTVDNGIAAFEAATLARELGVDLIVTDHHEIDRDLPPAVAVLNPKRDDPGHPAADACGTAVAFKLAMALNVPSDLGLVALATIADVVPLTRENRVLTARGLAEISKAPLPGIRALAQVARVDTGTLLAETVAFQLSPRINAAGRLGDPRTAVELLLTDDADIARRLAGQLDALNRERRDREAEIYEEAAAQAQEQLADECHALVLAGKQWHPGLVGIVASKLVAKHARPVVMIAVDEAGLGRASGRSTTAFDLVEALRESAELLERYGGHAAAAGMTIRENNIPRFAERFELHAAALSENAHAPTLHVDANIAFTLIDRKLLDAIARLEPFGHRNPAPVFGSNGVDMIPESFRELRGGHARCAFQCGAESFAAIGFGMAESFRTFRDANAFDIAFTPKFNHWNGQSTIQLQLKDIRQS